MNNIPLELRNEMAMDPFYLECALADDGECIIERKIEWHHVLIHAARQLQSKAFIVPACDAYHHRFANRSDIAYRFLRVALNRANTAELEGLSKAVDYVRLRDAMAAGDNMGIATA